MRCAAASRSPKPPPQGLLRAHVATLIIARRQAMAIGAAVHTAKTATRLLPRSPHHRRFDGRRGTAQYIALLFCQQPLLLPIRLVVPRPLPYLLLPAAAAAEVLPSTAVRLIFAVLLRIP